MRILNLNSWNGYPKTKLQKRYIFSSLLCLVAIDQKVKHWIVQTEYFNCALNSLCIELYKNSHFYFGLFTNYQPKIYFFVDAFLMLTIFFLTKFICTPERRCLYFTPLLFSGIISNLIDKYRNGYVIDYFSLKLFGLPFNQFNLADIYILASIVGLVWELRGSQQIKKYH